MSKLHRYNKMFDTPLLNALFKGKESHLNEQILWAKNTLKKDDWAVWYLRVYKLSVFIDHLQSLPHGDNSHLEGISASKEYSFLDKMKTNGFVGDDIDIREIRARLKHMVDLNLSSINKMVFGWTPPAKLFSEAEDLELTWKAQNEDTILPEYGVKIIEFEDGSAWFDLQRGGCQVEGRAMGHCGNGNGYSNQTILSYRQPLGADEQGGVNWRPFLTFILNKDNGVLGEMKGRGNSKPATRYHPYILELLLNHDPIKRVIGGGYLPENNFSLSDLDNTSYNDLITKKPTLFSVIDLYEKFGDIEKIGDHDFNQLVDNALSENGSVVISNEDSKSEEKAYILERSIDLQELASIHRLSDLDTYAKIILDGPAFAFEGSGDWKNSYIDLNGIMTELNEKKPDLYQSIVKVLEFEIDDGDCYMDLQSPSDLINFIEMDESSEIGTVFSMAHSETEEAGAEMEMHEAIEKMADNFFRISGLKLVRDDSADEYHTYHVCITKKGFFSSVDSYKDEIRESILEHGNSEMEAINSLINEGYIEAKDLDVPYYGFSGFDEEYFKERLFERLQEYVSDNPLPSIDLNEPKKPSGPFLQRADVLPSNIARKVYGDSELSI